MTKDAETEEALSVMLDNENSFASFSTCADLKALEDYMGRTAVSVAVLDLDDPGGELLEALEPVVNRNPRTKFIGLVSDLQNDLLLKAMQAGIRHLQLKAEMEGELREILKKFSASNGNGSSGPKGKVVTVLSSSGGCGATTLAVNLANELQASSPGEVMLVDLDYHYGAVATYLELTGRYSVADLLTYDGQLDAQLVDSTSLSYSKNLKVLISPASTDLSSAQELNSDNLASLIDTCKSAYASTVIDAPRVTMDVAAELVAASDVTLLVMQLTVKDIRVAKMIFDSMRQRGIGEDKIKAVANRIQKRNQMISLADAQSAIGHHPLEHMRNDFSGAIRSMNYGKPLAEAAPRSVLRRDVLRIVDHVLGSKTMVNGTKGA